MKTLQEFINDAVENTFERTLQNKIDNAIYEHLCLWDGKISRAEMAEKLKFVLETEYSFALEAVKRMQAEEQKA